MKRRQEAEGSSPVARGVRIRLPVQETRVKFLNQKDPLEKETATHSSIFAWRIPWSLAGYSP